MNLILSRHGNTFTPGETAVWTGSTNDLPLVEKGLEQAEAFAKALKAQGVRPAAVYCGPLKRTRAYAGLVVERLGLAVPPVVDERLQELDYGEWTGLTNDMVKERFGEAALKAWDERCEWPPKDKGGWGGSPEETEAEAREFVAELQEQYGASDTVVAVTSNGRLRYFLALADGELERRVKEGTFKVKTGAVGKLVFADGRAAVAYWNADPAKTKL